MPDCPSEEQLASYVAGACGPEQAEAIEAHLKDCDRCRQWVQRARSDEAWFGRGAAGGQQAEYHPDGTLSAEGMFPSQPSAPDIPGYEIIRELHRGGQGVVYQAIQKSTKRRVAIKIMREGPFSGPRDRARFEREVQVLGQLNHPRIVAIHDSGSAAGHFYYTMDYISGQPLDEYVASTKAAIDETLRLFAKICEAVNAAHLRGVIHRDLKPGNIRIDPEGEPHILDFGLAKVATGEVTGDSRPQPMTMTGQFFGSLPWASPEQAEAIPSKIDIRTDVYSLGVILYHMLTGQFPYEVVGNVRDVMDNILKSEPAKPSTIRRQINDEVETIVLKCLSKERERRYQSAGELARDIHHYLAGEPIEAKRDSALYLFRKTIRRHKGTVVAAMAFAALLMGFGVVMSVQAERERKAKQEALAARDSARKAQAAEQQHRVVAEQERRNAEARTEEFRRTVYCNLIHLAQNAHQSNERQRLRELLDRCDEDLRHWEWRYLDKLSRQSFMTLCGHNHWVTAVTFNSDCRQLVSGDRNGTIKFWDTWNGQELRTLVGHEKRIGAIACSPDGTCIASGAVDGTIKLWNASNGEETLKLIGLQGAVSAVAFSPDGRRVAACTRGPESYSTRRGRTYLERTPEPIAVWDAESGQILFSLEGPKSETAPSGAAAFTAIAWSRDGRRLAAGNAIGQVRIWEGGSGTEILTVDRYGPGVSVLAFLQKGEQIAIIDEQGSVTVWDVSRGQDVLVVRSNEPRAPSLALSPDGERFACAYQGTIRVRNLRTGNETMVLRGHSGNISAIAFSADGRTIAAGGEDTTIGLWKLDSDNEIFALGGFKLDWLGEPIPLRPTALALSADGERLVSGSSNGMIRLWNASREPQHVSLQGSARDGSFRGISPDGKLAAVIRGRLIELWDVASGRELRTLWGHIHNVTAVAFNTDGTRIVSGDTEGVIGCWDIESGAELTVIASDQGRISALAFSPDGTMVASGSSGKLYKREGARAGYRPSGRALVIWDVETGREIRIVGPHQVSVAAIAFGPSGRRVAYEHGRNLEIVSVATGQQLMTLEGHERSVETVAFSPDGTFIASGSHDRTIKLWDAATGSEVGTLRGHEAPVTSLAFHRDGQQIASGDSEGTIRVWDVLGGHNILCLQSHTRMPWWVRAVGYTTRGDQIISGSSDGRLRLWDAQTGEKLRVVRGFAGAATATAVSPGGRYVACGSSEGTVKMWDLDESLVLWTLRGHEHSVKAVAFSPDGKRLASSSMRNVKIWTVTSGKEAFTVNGQGPVAFSLDGGMLAVGGCNSVLVYDCKGERELHRFSLPRKAVSALAFSSKDGLLACGAEDGSISLLDITSGAERKTLSGHEGAVETMGFSSDGKRIVSGSRDRTVKIWGVVSGQELITLRGHQAAVMAAVFAHDGQSILSAAADDTLGLWETVGASSPTAPSVTPATLAPAQPDSPPFGGQLVQPHYNSARPAPNATRYGAAEEPTCIRCWHWEAPEAIAPVIVSYRADLSALPAALHQGAKLEWSLDGAPFSNLVQGRKLIRTPGEHELSLMVTLADGRCFRDVYYLSVKGATHGAPAGPPK